MLVKDNVAIAAAARAIVRMNASSADEATTRADYSPSAAKRRTQKKLSRAETLLPMTQSYEMLRYAYASHLFVVDRDGCGFIRRLILVGPCPPKTWTALRLDHV